MVITKSNHKQIKRKTLNIEYEIARDLEKKAVELEITQTDLINILLRQGLDRLENQTTLDCIGDEQ